MPLNTKSQSRGKNLKTKNNSYFSAKKHGRLHQTFFKGIRTYSSSSENKPSKKQFLKNNIHELSISKLYKMAITLMTFFLEVGAQGPSNQTSSSSTGNTNSTSFNETSSSTGHNTLPFQPSSTADNIYPPAFLDDSGFNAIFYIPIVMCTVLIPTCILYTSVCNNRRRAQVTHSETSAPASTIVQIEMPNTAALQKTNVP